jgi:hypothetical protein
MTAKLAPQVILCLNTLAARVPAIRSRVRRGGELLREDGD